MITRKMTTKHGRVICVTNRNVLYRIFDDDRALLYVGATTNPGGRLRNHARHQPWWDEASTIDLKRFDTFEELAEAEIDAITSEEPRYVRMAQSSSPNS